MRSFKSRLPILAITFWVGVGTSVWATGMGFGETLYVAPTSYVATSYFSPTSYAYSGYYPTSYRYANYYPTAYSNASYYPTSYSYASYYPTAYTTGYEPAAVSSTYLTTAYTVRRGLFGRLRLVERPVLASYATSYMPTTYFAPTAYYGTSYQTTSYVPTVYAPRTYSYTYPTAWETSYVGTSGRVDDCDQVAWASPSTTATVPAQTYAAPSQTYSAPRSEAPSKAVRSEPADDPTIPSAVEPAPASEPPFRAPASDATKVPSAVDRSASSPPEAPVLSRPKNAVQPPAATPEKSATGAKTGTSLPAENPPAKPVVPAAPAGDPTELQPAPIEAPSTTRRDSLRPTYALRSTRLEMRNVLIGRVESENGEPLGEVPVSVTSRDDTSIRRTGMSNAFGNFAIRLSDGEWTVNVRTPSGRTYPVRTITVAGGKIMDNREGREVRNLIISY